MNTTIYENKIKVKIHGPNIEIEDGNMDFSTELTEEKEPNSCILKIYNLNETNINSILNNTQYVEIFTNQYGLKDDTGLLLWQNAFQGIPRETIKKTKPTKRKSKKPKTPKYLTPSLTLHNDGGDGDYYIQLELQEGKGIDIGTFVSKSYRRGFNIKKILRDLAKEANMEIVFDKNIKDFTVTYPIILHDNVLNSLIQVASYIGAKCTICNNRIYIVGSNPQGATTYFQFDEENIAEPKYLQDKKIEFEAPYMPSIVVGSFIRLVNKKLEIDGIYQVCKVESVFSNHSEECESKITVKY